MLKVGDVVLTQVQFTDTFETKKRPAVVLFGEFGNVLLAGITSNTNMDGIPLSKSEGAIKNSVIKLNYLFTVSEGMIEKHLFTLSVEKKKRIFSELMHKLGRLNN